MSVTTEMMVQIPRQSMIIVGAGLGGMSTGCYAQMNGYQSRIFEMHDLPGGCCTSWERKDYIFDWCVSWLLGSGPNNDMNQIWNELGALEGKKIKHFDIFNSVVGVDGDRVDFYAHPDALERHLLEISPEDAKLIRQFCNGIREFMKLLNAYPFLKPVGLMSFWERTKMMLPFIKKFNLIRKSMGTPMSEFAHRFKHPLLREAFNYIFYEKHPSFPLLPFYFNLACAAMNNAGVPEGGSLGLARSIESRYYSLGGQIQYDAKVTDILIENDTAVGIRLSNGTEHRADIVVTACDGPTVYKKMLKGKYTNEILDKLYGEMLEDPTMTFPSYFALFLGVDADYTKERHCSSYLLREEEAAQLPGILHPSINVQVRNIHYPHTAPPGKSIFFITYFCGYEAWNRLCPEETAKPTKCHTNRRRTREYREAKDKAAEFLIDIMDRHLPGLKDKVDYIDISTPLTQIRYTANHKGTVLAWQPFKDSGEDLEDHVNKNGPGFPGLSNLYMAGHWITTGGLIRAAATGRHIMHFICKEDGKEFTASQGIGETPAVPLSEVA